MIELISSLFKIGDKITIEYGNPINSICGTIFKILQTSIALKLGNGGIAGIKGDEIISFSALSDSNQNDQIQPDNCHKDEIFANEGKKDIEVESIQKDSTIVERNQASQDVQVSKPEPGFQVGDIIPLDVLKKIDPKVNKRNRFASQRSALTETERQGTPKTESTPTEMHPDSVRPQQSNRPKIVGKSFDALAVLVQEHHEQENLKMVPAIGAVSNVREDRHFGFIHDPRSGHDLFFSFNDIIDDFIPSCYQGLVFTEIKNAQGYKAVSVHRPGTVKDFLLKAEKQADKGNYGVALDIVEQILSQYPENFDATQAKTKYVKLYRSQKKTIVYKSEGSLYSKAKSAELKKKYEEAIKLYQKAIVEGDKTNSAIKDLAVLYVALFKSDYNGQSKYWKEEAIKLIDEYGDQLPKNITTSNFLLHNFYFPLANYEKSIDIIETLLEEGYIKSDNGRYSNLLYTKAYNLLRLGKIEDAKEAVVEALSFNPQYSPAVQLKEQIDNIDITDREQLEQLVTATEFNIVSGGLSPYIIQTLKNYDEYAGVKTKDIESRNFTASTLKDVRNVIDKAGSARAKERASYLLTEGKLMQELEPADEIKLRRVMARYCNAMALSHISENSPLDIIRFFYDESFALEENWDLNLRQVYIYLLTHVKNYNELIYFHSKQKVSVNEALTLLLPKIDNIKLWDNILTMCLNNGTIFAQLFSQIYTNRIWKEKAIAILEDFNRDNVTENISQGEFIEIWNTVRENRLNQLKQLTANIKSLGNCANIEEATAQLDNIRKFKENWILPLDTRRLNTIANFIYPALESFVKSHGYRNKESNYNNAIGQIQQFVDEITNGPTKLSYEAMLPLMNKLRVLLKEAYDEVVVLSEPKVTLTLLSKETVINGDGNVSLQISVSNHRDSSPIKEVSVEVLDDTDVKFIPISGNIHYNAIEGGESSIFKINIKVSNRVINNRATAINISCKYKSGENAREQKSQVTLKLYSQEDYKPIYNPYAPVADGGPVPTDSKMFYGRDEFIGYIVDAITHTPSKQFIIYGQKRCGKSSVMLHLKEKLEATGKNLCVFFSLGDIIQNLTEASLYHKILSSIKDELDDIEFDGEIVPDLQLPNAKEFNDEDPANPLNTFTKYMRLFKRACKTTRGWENRNLVVMIDEFTYLYTEIKKGHISSSIMKQWKAVTQNEKAQFSVVLVGQDVVPSFKKEDYARNAFGVIEDIRLTYLQDEPARELIENPILDENGESRYIGNAVSKIIEYTSRNPYYIQIFCARLVDFMNRNKSINVTEADVNDVAKSFSVGEQALEEDKFDNLIRAGETEDLQEFPESEILAILRQIAVGSSNVGYCCIDDINVLGDKNRERDIIKHLIDREVLEQKGKNNYRIQVKLFQEWLLNH